ncbi:hypothetical protein C5167_049697 [Papaver somniferum]|uniref:Large ribosomal subunit protein uL1c n=1 Tax=Papaver somniferum TaxID=3469 RepID=A0A4Y7KMZ0_PAPSO|nr:uncharacterized protein LOC113302187 [Papaver somniferum]RZC74217.1 hypothetical protein C5167_049697 [Papaver somniferum]
MAALELIFSHARRHCTRYPPSHLSLLFSRSSSSSHQHSLTGDLGFCKSPSSFLGFHRYSSSSTNGESDTTPSTPTQSVPIKPVSYAVKPKDPSKNHENISKAPEIRRERVITRTAPVDGPIKPVSYDVKPSAESEAIEGTNVESRDWTREDIRYVKDLQSVTPTSYPIKVAPLPEDRASTTGDEENQQLDQERRKIENLYRIRRSLNVQKEEIQVPFPTLIRAEKNKPKVVLDLQEAIREVKASAKRNFVETVEVHVNLGVDPRRGNQMVRGAVTLPHGTGKTVRVAVFAEGSDADEAKEAGADVVGGDELIEEIRKGGGKLNFDKCIATPIFMPRLGKIARILGPRGLMPNPKLGSVTSDVSAAVKDAKRGRVDFKLDKTAIVHAGLGKVTLSEESLRENIGAFVNALLVAKPVGLKKTSKYVGYVKGFTLCSTMGPGFPVSIQSLSLAADNYNKLKLQ